jgi:hypothetical protein
MTALREEVLEPGGHAATAWAAWWSFTPKVLAESGRQEQPGFCHQALVIEGHMEVVEAVRDSHPTGALRDGDVGWVGHRQFPKSRQALVVFQGTLIPSPRVP